MNFKFMSANMLNFILAGKNRIITG